MKESLRFLRHYFQQDPWINRKFSKKISDKIVLSQPLWICIGVFLSVAECEFHSSRDSGEVSIEGVLRWFDLDSFWALFIPSGTFDFLVRTAAVQL